MIIQDSPCKNTFCMDCPVLCMKVNRKIVLFIVRLKQLQRLPAGNTAGDDQYNVY